MISVKVGFKEAPPTRKPSTSGSSPKAWKSQVELEQGVFCQNHSFNKIEDSVRSFKMTKDGFRKLKIA